MKNVLFLDYDGVVNRKMWTQQDGRWVCRWGYPEDGKVNDAQAVQWVSEFCETCGFDIVVTSTWRKYPEWETCLKNGGLRENVKILGATSFSEKGRPQEIAEFLATHPEIEAYVIVDDNDALFASVDPLDLEGGSADICSGHLVTCSEDHGFGEEEYRLAAALYFRQKYLHMRRTEERGGNCSDAYALTDAARELLSSVGLITVTLLQRGFYVGYEKALRIIEELLLSGDATKVVVKGEAKYKLTTKNK